MRSTAIKPQFSESVLHIAEQQLRDHQQLIYKRTDRMFVTLMVLQWLAGVILAVWISPKTWVAPKAKRILTCGRPFFWEEPLPSFQCCWDG